MFLKHTLVTVNIFNSAQYSSCKHWNLYTGELYSVFVLLQACKTCSPHEFWFYYEISNQIGMAVDRKFFHLHYGVIRKNSMNLAYKLSFFWNMMHDNFMLKTFYELRYIGNCYRAHSTVSNIRKYISKVKFWRMWITVCDFQ